MKHRRLKIQNQMGIHARSAAELVKLAGKYNSKIEIEYGNMRANAKSILGIMSLGVRNGDEVTVYASGADEVEALDAIEDLINKKFYEE